MVLIIYGRDSLKPFYDCVSFKFLIASSGVLLRKVLLHSNYIDTGLPRLQEAVYTSNYSFSLILMMSAWSILKCVSQDALKGVAKMLPHNLIAESPHDYT